jgi:hypothetical protein
MDEIMWKKAVMVCFWTLSQNVLEEPEKNNKHWET